LSYQDGINNKGENMGMDVYGLSPTIRLGTKKPERPKDLHKASRDVIDKYFKEEQEYEDKNPGVYFRNNCWGWRPLGYFIIEKCGWLTTEQKESLQNNSGFEFSHHEAGTIADTLQKKVDDGTAAEREEVNKREMAVAEEWNKGINAQQGELEKEVKKETGDAKLVPYDYPEHFKKKWDDLQKQTDHKAHYPFRESNVKEFIQFLRECGGFQIC
jgi:hypothetical protein